MHTKKATGTSAEKAGNASLLLFFVRVPRTGGMTRGGILIRQKAKETFAPANSFVFFSLESRSTANNVAPLIAELLKILSQYWQ